MLLFAMLTLGLAVFLAGEVVTMPQRRRAVALKRASGYGAVRNDREQEIARFKERVLVPAVERLAALALRVNPKASADAIGSRLIAAGLSSRITPSQFLAVKSGAALLGAVVAVVFGVTIAAIAGVVLVPVFAGF